MNSPQDDRHRPPSGAAAAEREYDLVALGDPVLDLYLMADGLPAWDDKQLGRRAAWMPGGSEANAACAASRLGLKTALMGHIGTGPEADLLREDLVRFGVDLRLLRTVPGTLSALAVVHLSTNGERAITYVPMASEPPPWDAVEALMPRTRAVYLLPYDLGRFGRVAALARACGTEVAVDVERAVAERPGALEALCTGADILCFNEAGFRRLTDSEPTLAHAASLLQRSRAHTLAVSLGRHGALAVNRQGGRARQAAFACEVVDTTGAGDSFNAAFVGACLSGQGLQEALSRACATAALCIEAMGPRAGLANGARVEAERRSRGLQAQGIDHHPKRDHS